MGDSAGEGDKFVCLCKSEENDREFLTFGHSFGKRWRTKAFILRISIDTVSLKVVIGITSNDLKTEYNIV